MPTKHNATGWNAERHTLRRHSLTSADGTGYIGVMILDDALAATWAAEARAITEDLVVCLSELDSDDRAAVLGYVMTQLHGHAVETGNDHMWTYDGSTGRSLPAEGDDLGHVPDAPDLTSGERRIVAIHDPGDADPDAEADHG